MENIRKAKGFINKNGEKVLMIPADHKHEISEITELQSILDGKADKTTPGPTPPVNADNIHSEYEYAKVSCENNSSYPRGTIILHVEDSEGEPYEANITSKNIDNLNRALKTPDEEPTRSSDNLITSGAIANIIRSIGYTYLEELPLIKLDGSIMEGSGTGVVADYAHAEGDCTIAAGKASHAEGKVENLGTAIDVTKLWIVKNPIIEGEVDYRKIVLKCDNVESLNLISVGDVILYKGFGYRLELQYAKVRAVEAVPGDPDSFYLRLTSPIKVNVTSDIISKTLYKVTYGAFGEASHVEGYETIANGKASHAEGLNTIANGDYLHVQGKYNIVDSTGDYAFIVGNGTEELRSNVFAVKWNGDVNGNAIKTSITTSGDGNKLPTVGAIRTALSYKLDSTSIRELINRLDAVELGKSATWSSHTNFQIPSNKYNNNTIYGIDSLSTLELYSRIRIVNVSNLVQAEGTVISKGSSPVGVSLSCDISGLGAGSYTLQVGSYS